MGSDIPFGKLVLTVGHYKPTLRHAAMSFAWRRTGATFYFIRRGKLEHLSKRNG